MSYSAVTVYQGSRFYRVASPKTTAICDHDWRDGYGNSYGGCNTITQEIVDQSKSYADVFLAAWVFLLVNLCVTCSNPSPLPLRRLI